MGATFISRSDGGKIAGSASKWQLGTKPVYAGTTRKGADCSGSTWSIYKEARFAYDMKYWPSSQFPANPHFKLVSNALPQEGDVAWWPGHVAIYAGDGQIWTAHHAGGPTCSQDELSNWVKRKGPVKWYRYCE